MRSGFVAEGKVGGGGPGDEDTLACLLGQGTGEGITIGDATVAIPEEVDEFIDMEGALFISQYLDGEIDEGLTSSASTGRGCGGVILPAEEGLDGL